MQNQSTLELRGQALHNEPPNLYSPLPRLPLALELEPLVLALMNAVILQVRTRLSELSAAGIRECYRRAKNILMMSREGSTS